MDGVWHDAQGLSCRLDDSKTWKGEVVPGSNGTAFRIVKQSGNGATCAGQ